jgi:epoxyqueuosine reductase
MAPVRVTDARGRALSPCPEARARKLLESGSAQVTCQDPLTIRLGYAVDLPVPGPRVEPGLDGDVCDHGPLLLHICCGPCSIYSVQRLREQGWQVEGYWYNPNIHPYTEHTRRQESLRSFAPTVNLPIHWEPGYALADHLRAVAGREDSPDRCLACYRLRLEKAAMRAAERGIRAISTTLLISPYQNREALVGIGTEVAAMRGLAFHSENLRRGFAVSQLIAREMGLYRQRYCGCLFSARDAEARAAARDLG